MNTKKTSERKTDHIDMAFASQVNQNDNRFYYEPILSAHPVENFRPQVMPIAGKQLQWPVWVSSMTGGAEKAGHINRNLAKACGEFGLGMGLGSCRIILEDNTYLPDFSLRKLAGNHTPLFANLGIAQLEELFAAGKARLIHELIDKTETNGLIIHVNPFQEWLQPEGDRFAISPLETIKRTLDALDKPIIVKEVGQGMGPESLEALMQLPLEAIDFGASGGTNFSMLELLRADEQNRESFEPLAAIGHKAEEMCCMVNELLKKGNRLGRFIISGGISDFLDGYYHINLINAPAIYGQASSFLKHALGDYEQLQKHILHQTEGLKLAYSFLKVKK